MFIEINIASAKTLRLLKAVQVRQLAQVFVAAKNAAQRTAAAGIAVIAQRIGAAGDFDRTAQPCGGGKGVCKFPGENGVK